MPVWKILSTIKETPFLAAFIKKLQVISHTNKGRPVFLFICLNHPDSPISFPIHIGDGPFDSHVTAEPDARRLGNPSCKKLWFVCLAPQMTFAFTNPRPQRQVDEESKIQKKEYKRISTNEPESRFSSIAPITFQAWRLAFCLLFSPPLHVQRSANRGTESFSKPTIMYWLRKRKLKRRAPFLFRSFFYSNSRNIMIRSRLDHSMRFIMNVFCVLYQCLPPHSPGVNGFLFWSKAYSMR